MTKETILNSKNNIAELLANSDIVAAYLYGSVAAGTATVVSDIDIALFVSDKIDKSDYLDLEMELSVKIGKLLNADNIDVRIINQAPLKIKGEVLTKSILLYSGDESGRVEFESVNRLKYFDMQPFLIAQQKSFINKMQRKYHG